MLLVTHANMAPPRIELQKFQEKSINLLKGQDFFRSLLDRENQFVFKNFRIITKKNTELAFVK